MGKAEKLWNPPRARQGLRKKKLKFGRTPRREPARWGEQPWTVARPEGGKGKDWDAQDYGELCQREGSVHTIERHPPEGGGGKKCTCQRASQVPSGQGRKRKECLDRRGGPTSGRIKLLAAHVVPRKVQNRYKRKKPCKGKSPGIGSESPASRPQLKRETDVRSLLGGSGQTCKAPCDTRTSPDAKCMNMSKKRKGLAPPPSTRKGKHGKGTKRGEHVRGTLPSGKPRGTSGKLQQGDKTLAEG